MAERGDPGQRAAVLASGGLDSAVLLAEALGEYGSVLPIYVRTGLVWEDVEIHWLHRFVEAIRRPGLLDPLILELPVEKMYGGHWSITGKGIPGYDAPDEACYLPGRNIILFATAAVLCRSMDIGTILHGTLRGNPFPDATERFFSSMQESLGIGLEFPIRLVAPFRDRTKSDIMALGRDLPLEYSFSCISPKGLMHCGDCNKCAERAHAFKVAGIRDVTEYARPGS